MKIRFKEIEGRYKAKLTQIKEEKSVYGPYLKLIFTVMEGDLSQYRFTGAVKPTPIKESKFYKWVTNILGREPEDEFCVEEMIGKECMIYLSKYKNYYSVSQVSLSSDE